MNRTTWLSYFRSNQTEPGEIPWHRAQEPPPVLAHFLIPSLQQFQLGEGASGITFLEKGRAFAQRTGDLDFVEALALFIAEEQRHSGMLARYLRSVGAPVLRRHWVDGIFRRLRKQAGLECMVTVLVTAEMMAVPYYRSVLKISACPVLKAICRRILREEGQHLLFQASTLGKLQRTRGPVAMRLTQMCQRFLLAGTCAVVWKEHGKVLRAAGMSPVEFFIECRRLLRHVAGAARRGTANLPTLHPQAPWTTEVVSQEAILRALEPVGRGPRT
ncbi:MAG: ferritin-like domain-containing protein [Bryobacteraceae bacterium]